MVAAIDVGLKQVERKQRALKALAVALGISEAAAMTIYLRGVRDAGVMEGTDNMLDIQADSSVE